MTTTTIPVSQHMYKLGTLQLMCYQEWKNKTLLLVDNNEANNILLNDIYDWTGLTVEYVDSGRKAIERILRGEDVHIVFLELRLPDVDGFTIFRIIKKISPIPIIAYTASVMNNEKQRCFDTGFTDFISKPADLGAYFRVLGEILG